MRIRIDGTGHSANMVSHPVYEFHILASVRRKYAFDESLYSSSGNVIFPNFHAVRQFAKKLNDHPNLARHPEHAVRAGQLNAMGLIDEISHYVLRKYDEIGNPGVIRRSMEYLTGALGVSSFQAAIESFGTQFPPIEVHRGIHSLEEYLSKHAGSKSYREVALEEMILLWLANINPAFSPFKELFNDQNLRDHSSYPAIIGSLQSYFASEKGAGPESTSILDLLRAPILASPHSLEGQLQFMRTAWGIQLSRDIMNKMTGAGDLVREETRILLPPGHQETVVPRYVNISPFGEIDEERFSTDIDWMPNVVLLAKNIYVWLDQLSKKYSRPVTRLDEIPDEELDRLAEWNFNALWLIGIWERSRASQTIKQVMGNPEAVASAYSLFDYEIAHALGGEASFENLRSRAWRRGIRIAGDMVPNHVGIFAKWVIEHPEYFIRAEYSPFPNYSFTGANLSDDPNVEIRIEDGYWTKRDAAVVFQRKERSTGNIQYIYHGNDGTQTPWNDTAQLDFLRQDVREAVIDMILHVARKFPIIRFDAAMVLTKQHFQRLWYPQPGSGGDIPSRSDHALAKDQFDRAFPTEFWRDVVDRINRDLPNTLLLAEAFWLLEGYFVRTLGMHRVYNSAFMHMMMKEETAKYRELIKNTLAFNPEILKRYVNFMSNPDERTAIDQFGKDDKYFGTAMMMVTMPGLPMFAHGQIEGFGEKYGMEYQKAYHNENEDQALIDRHRREIFPLLKKRYLFSQVSSFELYNAEDAHGNIMEQVICYSNRAGSERALFCYNNRYESSSGWVGGTVPKVQMDGTTASGKTLGEILGLRREDGFYYIMKEHQSGLEFIRSGRELCEQRMTLKLQGFQYQLFHEFREVHDEFGEYSRLARWLGGTGTGSIESALREMKLTPVHEAYRLLEEALSPERCMKFLSAQPAKSAEIPKPVGAAYRLFLERAFELLGINAGTDRWERAFEESLNRVRTANLVDTKTDHRKIRTLTAWLICRNLDEVCGRPHAIDHLNLLKIMSQESAEAVRILQAHGASTSRALEAGVSGLDRVFDDPIVERFIDVNTYNNTVYFSKERFEELLDLLFAEHMITVAGDQKNVAAAGQELRKLAAQSGYRLAEMRRSLASSAEIKHA